MVYTFITVHWCYISPFDGKPRTTCASLDDNDRSMYICIYSALYANFMLFYIPAHILHLQQFFFLFCIITKYLYTYIHIDLYTFLWMMNVIYFLNRKMLNSTKRRKTKKKVERNNEHTVLFFRVQENMRHKICKTSSTGKQRYLDKYEIWFCFSLWYIYVMIWFVLYGRYCYVFL